MTCHTDQLDSNKKYLYVRWQEGNYDIHIEALVCLIRYHYIKVFYVLYLFFFL